MSRDTSTSPSEGEIIESSSEKANFSFRPSRHTSVDRRSRHQAPPLASTSPRESYTYEKNDQTRRYRSRSPYREPRGQKRSREGDHYDASQTHPRRSHPRHEPSEDPHRNVEQTSRYPHHQRGASHHNSVLREDRSDTRRRDRDRRDRPRQQNGNGSMSTEPKYDVNERRTSIDKSSNRRDRNQTGTHVEGFAASDVYLELETKSDGQVAKSTESADVVPGERSSNLVGISSFSIALADESLEPDPAQVDEAQLIEERRKRREAIKAKYKGESTPQSRQSPPFEAGVERASRPLDQAEKDIKPSGPATIKSKTKPEAPIPAEALNSLSLPDSPSDPPIADDIDLANDRMTRQPSSGEDEPSAADYEPQMDMESHIARQKRQGGRNVLDTFSAADGQLVTSGSAIAERPQHQSGAHSADEFDMFAEDFAEMMPKAPMGKTVANTGADLGTTAPSTKAIDMGMLDDWDDHEGYYKVMLGELLDSRYHVQSNLGKGMFSGVVRATDQMNQRLVAIKIVRSNETMYKAGQKEIGILHKLREADIEDKKHLIRLERSFEHKGHLCMVFENLSINLREVLKKFGRDVGINLKAVRAYAQQMFLGLGLLRKCNILHADLKPDNILVTDSRNTLKICDLGSASDVSENEITQYLVSRFYRAPEIILGFPYDFAIDMWSVGCTLFELYTGKILFTGRNNNQMLRLMMECRGKFSHKMLRKAQFANHHFDDLLNFRSVETDRVSGKDIVRTINITRPVRDLKARLLSNTNGLPEAELKELNLFADLLDRCLNLNPEKRCTPAEALKHSFITRQKN